LDFRTVYLKKGLRQSVEILSEETSISSTVNISKDQNITWNNKYIDINIITNKLSYNSMIKAKATNPVGFNNWTRHLKLDENPDMLQIYSFIYFARK
jgi:hypothetical protein